MSLRDEKNKYEIYKKNASKNEYRCMNCCRTIYIPIGKDKKLCPTCGQMIERNEKNNIENISIINRLKIGYYHYQKNKEM